MPFDPRNQDHVSLLLYLECRAVDQRGAVDVRHMNEDDARLAAAWAEEGFISYGRICSADIRPRSFSVMWVFLSDRAHDEAAKARRDRAKRCWMKREFRTTDEFNRSSAPEVHVPRTGGVPA